MAKRVYIFHWNETEARELALRITALGATVEFEHEDGARGARRVVQLQPHLVVVSLMRLPSHGRATADGISTAKKTRHIPIMFVGGMPEAVEKTKAKFPKAVYVEDADLEAEVKKFIRLK